MYNRKACLVALSLVLALAITHAQGDLQRAVRTWIAGHQTSIVAELIDLLAIPNVAADRPNIRRNAVHLRAMLERRGFASEILETTGNPLVYGALTVPGATRTLLLYAHYDGQPVDPAAWKQADPFRPVLRTGRIDRGGRDLPDLGSITAFDSEWRIYARSAADDKAPIVALCSAIDALKASGLAPTSNLRIILDGEEEASSPSLVEAIGRYRDRLRADLLIVVDGPAHSSGRPTVAFGARGIITFDLTVFGPKAGVHSGNYGNWIPNPAQRLASLLASMKNDDGRVAVPGFYDGLPPLGPADRQLVETVPDDSARMLQSFGVARPEQDFPNLQEALQYPTLNIRGLVSAHVGAGARTIIPDRATAAIDIRLVAETRAQELLDKVRAHIRAQGYHLADGEPDDDLRARYSRIARMTPVGPITNAFRTPPTDPRARAVVAALERVYDAPPVQLRTLGGTVPISPFIEALGSPALLVPVVNFDNNQHEENENLRLGHLFEAIVTMAAILRM